MSFFVGFLCGCWFMVLGGLLLIVIAMPNFEEDVVETPEDWRGP